MGLGSASDLARETRALISDALSCKSAKNKGNLFARLIHKWTIKVDSSP